MHIHFVHKSVVCTLLYLLSSRNRHSCGFVVVRVVLLKICTEAFRVQTPACDANHWKNWRPYPQTSRSPRSSSVVTATLCWSRLWRMPKSEFPVPPVLSSCLSVDCRISKCYCSSSRAPLIMTHTLTAFMELMDHGIVSWENLSSVFITKVNHSLA